jgi:hypothetical protein
VAQKAIILLAVGSSPSTVSGTGLCSPKGITEPTKAGNQYMKI